jgi:hypothetical protein
MQKGTIAKFTNLCPYGRVQLELRKRCMQKNGPH